MTYLHSIFIPGADLDSFRVVDEALPSTRPTGLMARYVGTSPDGLVVTAVWSSKADADRFGAEEIGPTVRRIHGDGAGGELLVEYEVADVILVETTA